MADLKGLRTLISEIRTAVRNFRGRDKKLVFPEIVDPFVENPELRKRLEDPYGLAGPIPVLPGHDHTISPIGEWGPNDPNFNSHQARIAATRHLEGTGGGMAIGGSTTARTGPGIRQQQQRSLLNKGDGSAAAQSQQQQQ